MPGTLYLVSTPIGNLGDITLRAAEVLRAVPLIAAEDTRVTRKLLSHLDIHTRLVSYYEHNRMESGAVICRHLTEGGDCALVTDAGTPAVSDPGQDLVSMCIEQDITVVPIPGPTALIPALTVSGLATGRFCFEGFLSTNRRGRRKHLEEIQKECRTLIFYEAPHKLQATLTDLYRTLGNRRIAVCRELTKLHEEVLRMDLAGAIDHFAQSTPKGEFVLVLEGAEPEEELPDLERAALLARSYLEQGLPRREAVRRAAAETGASRNTVYDLVKESGSETSEP